MFKLKLKIASYSLGIGLIALLAMPAADSFAQDIFNEQVSLDVELAPGSPENRAADIDQPGTKIVGGQAAPANAWPWQVAIYRRMKKSGVDSGWGFCGGSVINRNWVMSAAHCFQNKPDYDAIVPGDLQVVEGTKILDIMNFGGGAGRGRKLSIKRIVLHEAWNPSLLVNDIAMLELESPATSSPVPLASPAPRQPRPTLWRRSWRA
jgi:hypothetical protein